MTVWQENASRFATSSEDADPDMLLDVAVKDALKAIREDRPGWALYVLTRTTERCARILGKRGAS